MQIHDLTLGATAEALSKIANLRVGNASPRHGQPADHNPNCGSGRDRGLYCLRRGDGEMAECRVVGSDARVRYWLPHCRIAHASRATAAWVPAAGNYATCSWGVRAEYIRRQADIRCSEIGVRRLGRRGPRGVAGSLATPREAAAAVVDPTCIRVCCGRGIGDDITQQDKSCVAIVEFTWCCILVRARSSSIWMDCSAGGERGRVACNGLGSACCAGVGDHRPCGQIEPETVVVEYSEMTSDPGSKFEGDASLHKLNSEKIRAVVGVRAGSDSSPAG
ncbi:hypothetical protein B0H17DRAFT_1296276 [Mycena rosella]|uniref:Uncharacterized protein n=1 Tax=Mycena rosella TaxID=1033263 RepID=A0AAD7DE45_MYCRO|nr:hypothetical protein B0H17DRAFT_1296276 [Mycena rosella]